MLFVNVSYIGSFYYIHTIDSIILFFQIQYPFPVLL